MAGTERSWSVARIEHVDASGQVHFIAVPPDDPARGQTAGSLGPIRGPAIYHANGDDPKFGTIRALRRSVRLDLVRDIQRD